MAAGLSSPYLRGVDASDLQQVAGGYKMGSVFSGVCPMPYLEKTIAMVGVAGALAVLGTLAGKTWGTNRRFQSGLRSYEAGDYDGAIAQLQEAIARQPSNDLARLLLGNALAAKGDPEAAIAVFEDSIARSPRNIDGHLGLGKVLLRQGETAAALDRFRAAVAIAPQRNPEPHVALGLALKASGDADSAAAALDTARTIYEKQGQTEAARAIAEELGR